MAIFAAWVISLFGMTNIEAIWSLRSNVFRGFLRLLPKPLYAFFLPALSLRVFGSSCVYLMLLAFVVAGIISSRFH